jgi:hypothetical protein
MTDDQPTSTPPDADWREARRAERRQRLTSRYGWIGPGMGGIILVLLGLIFLAQNLGYPVPEKWWTVFLLIPALGASFAAWNAYQRDGRLNGEATAALLGAVTLFAIAAALLFDFAWGTLWPLVLVAVGGGILIRAYWR